MDQNLENRIDRYVQGNLNVNEKDKFEKELQADDALKKRVEALMSLKESFNRKDIQDLKEKLNKLDQFKYEEQSKLKSIRAFSIRKYWPIAASLAIIMAVFFFMQNSNKRDTLSILFEENSPFKNEVTRGTENPFSKLQSMFLNKDYQNALGNIESTLNSNSVLHQDLKTRLEEGRVYALIGLERYEEAEQILASKKDCYSIWLKWIIAKKSDIGDIQQYLDLMLENKCVEYKNTIP